MDIRHTVKNRVAILHLSGQFGYSDEKRLADLTESLIKDNPSVVAIDATKIDYINSIGVAALFGILKIVDEVGAEFVVFGANANTTVILEKVFENDFVPILSEEEFKRKYLS